MLIENVGKEAVFWYQKARGQRADKPNQSSKGIKIWQLDFKEDCCHF